MQAADFLNTDLFKIDPERARDSRWGPSELSSQHTGHIRMPSCLQHFALNRSRVPEASARILKLQS